MSLTNAKMKSLKDKLEEKEVLGKQLAEVDSKIDELAGDKKVKIKSNKKK